jgi:hypothetical protein
LDKRQPMPPRNTAADKYSRAGSNNVIMTDCADLSALWFDAIPHYGTS